MRAHRATLAVLEVCVCKCVGVCVLYTIIIIYM
jgi:hypothetical protein